MTEAAITIGIINYETRSDLKECLDSLGSDFPIVVIDNASTDGSAEMVRADFSDVLLYESAENIGYGAAANTAMALASTPYLLLMNADVRIAAEMVDRLVQRLETEPDLSMVGPRIENGDGVLQQTWHNDPTPSSVFADSSGLVELGRRIGIVRKPTLPTAGEFDWVLGAVLAIRRTAFEAVGGFDPAYFLYFEEIDLARRLREARWLVGFEPSALAIHHGAGSTGRTPVESERHLYRSGSRWFDRHGTRRARRLYQWATATAMASRWAGSPLAPHPPSRRGAAKAVIADAIADWPNETVRPDANQRADWRAVIPWPDDSPRLHVDGLLDSRWLAADGWLAPKNEGAEVSVELGPIPSRHLPAAPVVVWRRRGLRGWVAHRRRLAVVEANGFGEVRTYWAIPNFDSCRRLIPLDDDAPLQWWGSTLAADNKLAQRLARYPGLARRILKEIGPDLLFVTAKAPQSPNQRLVITSGYDPASRTVVVEFAAGSNAPTTIEKWATRPTGNAASHRERETLKALHHELPSNLTPALSEPITHTLIGGLAVARERPVAGPTLSARIGWTAGHDANRMADATMLLSEATQWLAGLHKSTAVDEPWSFDRWIGELVSDLEAYRPLSPAVHTLVERIQAQTSTVAPSEIPTVRRHFDFGPWNLLYGERLGVIDWESAPPRPKDGRGLAGADLMYLAKYWLHLTMPEGPDAAETLGFHFLANENDATSQRSVAARVLADFAETVGIDRAWMPAIFVHTWLEQSCFDHARHGAMITGRSRSYLDTAARHGSQLIDWWVCEDG